MLIVPQSQIAFDGRLDPARHTYERSGCFQIEEVLSPCQPLGSGVGELVCIQMPEDRLELVVHLY
jgi:hypothetical protein